MTSLPELPDLDEVRESSSGRDSSGSRRREGRRYQKTTWFDRIGLGVVLLVLVWVVWNASLLIRADFQMMRARGQIISWSDGLTAWNLRSWTRARDDLNAALLTTPGNATIHDLLATLYLLRAHDTSMNAEVQRDLFGNARRHQEASLVLRPQHGWTWAGLAESLQALEPDSPAMWEAWQKARRFAPFEVGVSWSLARTALAAWKTASPEAKDWVKEFRGRLTLREQQALDALANRYDILLGPPPVVEPARASPGTGARRPARDRQVLPPEEASAIAAIEAAASASSRPVDPSAGGWGLSGSAAEAASSAR